MADLTFCEQTSVLSDFSQGDIIKIFGATDPKHHLGIIINADCDLAQKKNDGIVSYLPVYSLRDYVTIFWSEGFLRGKISAAINRIMEVKSLPNEDRARLENWIKEVTPEEIIDALCGEVNHKNALEIRRQVDVAHICLTCEDGFNAIRLLASKENKPEKFLADRVKEALKHAEESHLFISEIPGEVELGFLVRLKRIYSMEERDCFKSKAQHNARAPDIGWSAYRTAKLTGPMKYKFVHLFAHQFSRVGLPDETESYANLVVQAFVDSALMKEGK